MLRPSTMHSGTPLRSRGKLPRRRAVMSEKEIEAYLAARDTLRRIRQTSSVSAVSTGPVPPAPAAA